MSNDFDRLFDPSQNLPELPAIPARQAVPAIKGYIYQLWRSVDAWLQLETADEVIYLEGAEDIDRVGPASATTQQVKHESAGISLNDQRAHRALENFWILSEKEQSRKVDFHYMTTASAVIEMDRAFGETSGIEAWRTAQTCVKTTARIKDYLAKKLGTGSKLGAFLVSALPEVVQSKVVRRFHWFLAQPRVEDIVRSVDDRLVLFLAKKNIDSSYVEQSRDRLYKFVSSVIVQSESGKRRLTAADLHKEIEGATTVYLPLTAPQHKQLIAKIRAEPFNPGEVMLSHIRLPLPEIPSPLLARPPLVALIRKAVAERQAVLLIGSVFKGKTTLAQLVAKELCPDAWWFPMASRSGKETDTLLRGLAAEVQKDSVPSLIIVDDVDLAPSSHAIYRYSLSLLVSRAKREGRALLLAASGTSVATAQLSEFTGIQVIDVPEFSTEEIQSYCIENGCPERTSNAWAALILSATGGHPKLVQVRIAELTRGKWPPPISIEVLTNSQAIVNARQVARRLMSSSESSDVAEFLYTAAEATTPLTRNMLLSLLESIGNFTNGGDVVDVLMGRWLESVMVDRVRVTPMLRGSAADAWVPKRQRLAHLRLYDAIAEGRTLDVAEAASLLFHAFMSQNASRLKHCARILEGISDQVVSRAVYHHLMWVPLVALAPGQCFFAADPICSALLRQIQFSVSNEIDADSLAVIVDRWTEEVGGIAAGEQRDAMEAMLWSRISISKNPKVSLRTKLGAIDSLRRLSGTVADVLNAGDQLALNRSRTSPGGIPEDATTGQYKLLSHAGDVRSLADLNSLLDWLDRDASQEMKADFEVVLGWPIVRACGAFIHGAWSARHADENDWQTTIAVITRAYEIACRYRLIRYGSEAARTLSIIYGEHMKDHASAMRVLDEATAAFGDTVNLREQRVNALIEVGDDTMALHSWESLVSDPEMTKLMDPFAFRRAGISACRLERWSEAERYFLAGATTTREFQLETTSAGLVVDASYAAALGGQPKRAARLLAEVFLRLPASAFEDGHEGWDALFRVVHETREFIQHIVASRTKRDRKLAFGKASEPGLSFGSASPRQAFRTGLELARVGLLASQLGSVPLEYRDHLSLLRRADFPLVRLWSCQAMLAFEFNAGVGERFIDSLVAFDRALNTVASLPDSKCALEPDGGDTEPAQQKTVEVGWFPVLAAAVICCDQPVDAVRHWANDASKKWGLGSPVVQDLAMIASGLSMDPNAAWEILRQRTKGSRGVIFGAARALLRAGERSASETFSLQVIAAKATVSHEQGLLLQPTFAKPIARRFARVWKAFAQNTFQLVSPQTSVAPLLATLAAVDSGTASLKALLEVAAYSVGSSLGEIGAQLE